MFRLRQYSCIVWSSLVVLTCLFYPSPNVSAQCGPDAWSPVVTYKNVNGRRQRIVREARRPGEAFAHFNFSGSGLAGLPALRKIDEWGYLQLCPQAARLDTIAIEMQNNPSANAYIVVQGTTNGKAYDDRKFRAYTIVNYLQNNRGIDGSRLITVDGGASDEVHVQVFLGTKGNDQLGPDANKPVVVTERINGRLVQKSRKPRFPYEGYENYKFDAAFTVSERTDLTKISEVQPFPHTSVGYASDEELHAQIFNFRGKFYNEAPTVKGYIVVYAADDDQRSRLLQRAFASTLKGYLIEAGIDAERLITVDGGITNQDRRTTIEFWMDKL